MTTIQRYLDPHTLSHQPRIFPIEGMASTTVAASSKSAGRAQTPSTTKVSQKTSTCQTSQYSRWAILQPVILREDCNQKVLWANFAIISH